MPGKFSTYEESADFLSREIDIAGGFKKYDKNQDNSISGKEFYPAFEVQSRLIKGRYYYDSGEPTYVYDNTMDAAQIVFAGNGKLTAQQVFKATDPEEMGRSLRKEVQPLIEGVKTLGSDAYQWGKGMAPIAGKFMKGFLSDPVDEKGNVKSSVKGPEFITRREVEFYWSDKEMSYAARQKLEAKIENIFGGQEKLPREEYERKFNEYEMQRNKKGEVEVRRAEPAHKRPQVLEQDIDPKIRKQVEDALEKATNKGKGSSVIQPVNPLSLNKPQKEPEKESELC